MKNILLVLVLLLGFTSCTSKSAKIAETKNQTTVIKPEYKTLRAKHIDSNITTNIITFKEDNFIKGDTVWTRLNVQENYLEVVYNFPVDNVNVNGTSMFKVEIL